MEKKRSKIKVVLLFLIIFLILVSALLLFPIGRILITGRAITEPVIEEPTSVFKVDQILIKTLIKDDESMVRQINIMDISEEDSSIELEPQYLLDIVSISDNKFTLKPGQTKTVYINFTSSIEERGIKQEPGIYIGSLLIKTNPYTKRIPLIVEIETKEVLFDANIEVPIRQKQIEQGDFLEVGIKLFNLKKIGLTNINMDYFIKDIAGNTLITESEIVSVETQTSFVKTIHIPENLNPGEYVFGAIARYGSSVGTSTLLFEVASPVVEMKEELLSYYRNNKLRLWIAGIILAILISGIGSYMAFSVGSHIHDGIDRLFKEKPKKIGKPIEKKEEKVVEEEEKEEEKKEDVEWKEEEEERLKEEEEKELREKEKARKLLEKKKRKDEKLMLKEEERREEEKRKEEEREAEELRLKEEERRKEEDKRKRLLEKKKREEEKKKKPRKTFIHLLKEKLEKTKEPLEKKEEKRKEFLVKEREKELEELMRIGGEEKREEEERKRKLNEKERKREKKKREKEKKRQKLLEKKKRKEEKLRLKEEKRKRKEEEKRKRLLEKERGREGKKKEEEEKEKQRILEKKKEEKLRLKEEKKRRRGEEY